jgi:hypothetical protein
MDRSLWGYVVSVAVLVSAFILPLTTHASASRAATPVSDSATTCDVEPRQFEDIALLASTPVAPSDDADSTATQVDPNIVAAITDTVAQAVACANANDVLRSLALFTDRYVAERFGSDHPDDLGSLEAALSRPPVPAVEDDLLTLVSVEDVALIDKSSVMARVVTENRAQRFTDELVCALVDGRWLIDSWTGVDETNATPTSWCRHPFLKGRETHTIHLDNHRLW